MAMYYFPSFDVAQVYNLGSITLATSGKTSISIPFSAIAGPDQSSIGTTRYLGHYQVNGTWQINGLDPNATPRFADYSTVSFGRALRTALRAFATAFGWTSPTSIDVTSYYTISYSLPFTVVFSTAEGRAFMGFSASQGSTPSTFFTSDYTPNYMIAPTLTATSDHVPDFEPDGVGNHTIADDGSGFGISRTVSPLFMDWIQQYELVAKVFRLRAAASHPYTFQQLFEDCRGERPFIVSSGFGENFDRAFSFRNEGIAWKPSFAGPEKRAGSMAHIPFRCVSEGKVVQTS